MRSTLCGALTLCVVACGGPSEGDGGAATPGADAGGGAGGAGAGDGGEAWIPDYFPTTAWRERAPEELSYDPVRLEEAVDFAATSATEGLMIVQDGYVVAERYFGAFTADTRHESFSMAKSFASALVGIAIGDGLLAGVDERFCSYYPAWDCEAASDPRSRITLAHAMTLSTGLDWREDWSAGADPAANDAIQMATAARPIDYVLGQPSAAEPGTVFQYSTGDPALLSGVLEEVTGQTALAFAQERLLGPIGATGVTWNADADGHTTTFAGLQATVRDYARFGLLYLLRGLWDGEALVPSTWVDVSTRTGLALEPWYGYLWHVNLPVRFTTPELPADGYTAQGVSGQFIVVIPSERLVVVRVASDGILADEYDLAGLLTRILDARQR